MIIDLHVHTPPLSDDSTIQLPELVQKAKQAGIDGICVTEHGRFREADELTRLSEEHDFLILPGVELWSDDSHFLVFGLEEYSSGLWMVRKLRETVDEAGGVMILAHPSRRQYSSGADMEAAIERYFRESLLEYVDIVEVINGRSPESANEFSLELCRRLGLKGTGGSDAHSIDDIPSGATFFERDIRSLEELITELRAGRFRAIDLRENK